MEEWEWKRVDGVQDKEIYLEEDLIGCERDEYGVRKKNVQ